MPELLTRYPDTVMELLEGMGATCGKGKAEILTKCPRSNFCQVPNGEFCVLGLKDSNRLTQYKVKGISQSGGNNIRNYGMNWQIILVLVIILLAIYYIYRCYIRYQKQQERQNYYY